MATALATVGTDVQVSAYLLAQPDPPTLQVLPRAADYDQTFTAAGFDQRDFAVQGFVALLGDQAMQGLLDALMAPTGSRSVKTALEADKTLGGIVQTLRVTSDTGYTMQLHPSGAWFLVNEWTVEVRG